MKSIRRLLALSTAIVALGVRVSAASAGSQKPFHLEKVCDTATHSVVTASTFKPIHASSIETVRGIGYRFRALG